MRKILFILLICTSVYCQAQVLTEPDKAFSLSQSSGKPVLLVFSGSDWCMPCIQFEKKILEDTAFRSFANKYFIVLKADFPQKKKIPSSLQTQYNALADRYNPNGNFPMIILLSSTKQPIASFTFLNQTVEDFMNEIRQKL